MIPTFTAKASENLRAAELLFESQLYNACSNRAYYAALHAAVAALAKDGIHFDRVDHSAVQARFSGELIRRRKVYPGRFRSYLMRLQVVRDNADYKV
ncbi:MAG: HEPN domain-containing protein [bacterium]|nr:HEPN domain-containing protein [bacterium]